MSGGVELQKMQGKYEVKNFMPTCEVRSFSAEKDSFIYLESPKIHGSEGQQFSLRLSLKVIESGSGDYAVRVPDPTSKLGLELMVLAAPTAGIHIKFLGRLLNVDPSKTTFLEFAGFRTMETGRCRGWSPSYNPPTGFTGLTLANVFDESNGWLHDGTLRIEAEWSIAVDGDISKDIPKPKPLERLAADWGRLFQSGLGSDVIVRIKDEDVRAHSLVLMARSEVFSAMLSTPMREGLEKTIVISDLGVEAVKSMLQFLYSGELTPDDLKSDEKALGILEAAHRYNIEDLVDICVQGLTARFDVNSVGEWLYVADLMGNSNFRAKCMEFVRLHISEVQSTAKFTEFVATKLSLVTDVLACVVPPAKRRRTDAGNE
eukprot:TRINITY_DN82795_c0_g1_i1.p1 TRINITY_DN82795_c0_g1~~TRINITY_DN82795_c0_g1_i1.p1  ORF type:complete len:374 (-),score=67.20 TRINITY_DN82795_c0_g1_i1:101-1222(-)